MKTTLRYMTIFLLFVFGSRIGRAKDFEEIRESYRDVTTLEMETTSGDCEIIGSDTDEISVDVKYNITPAKNFQPEMRQRGNTLHISERWHGRSQGWVEWTITVPTELEVELSTASGDLTISGLKRSLEAEAASGDIEVNDCSGDIEVTTASGDLQIENCRGDLELSTASGDISLEDITGMLEASSASGDLEADNCSGYLDCGTASGDMTLESITCTESSNFSSASGDIEIGMDSPPTVDLWLSTASGDIQLRIGGKPVNARYVFECDKHRGKINSRFEFDKTEEFRVSRDTYLRKIIGENRKQPTVTVRTASGTITLTK